MNLLEFISQTNKATSADQLQTEFARFLAGRGIQRFMMGDLSPPSTMAKEEQLTLMVNYPDEWVSHYLQSHYVEVDPVYQRAVMSPLPFTWKQVMTPTLSRPARKMMSEAKECGLVSGVGLSMPQRHGRLIGIGFSSSEKEIQTSQDALSLLTTASHQFFAAYTRLQQPHPVEPIVLSDREREVLLWIAAGLSKPEVAEKLSVSQSCVKRHCENAFQKLQVTTLASAVAKATTWGLISPF